MKVIALTGNIAAGKSTVAAILRQHGAHIIDLDAIVHELQRPGTTVYRDIVRHFGTEVVQPNGELDRVVLRDRVMTSVSARSELEAIVHPAVALRQLELLDQEQSRGTSIVIVDIPLLFEVGNPAAYDGVILVDAPEAVRRERLIEQRGLSPLDADKLIASQLPAEEKRERSTWVLENDRLPEELERQTLAIWQLLRQ